MSWNLHRFPDDETLTTALSGRIAAALHEAVKQRGRAVLAVSGGSTPRRLFDKLSRLELPWEQITVTLVDERWVSQSHQDSNAALVHRHLLQGHAQRATFIGLTTDDPDPFTAQVAVNQRLTSLPRPWDVVLLGMGDDGHTASYFPGAPQLQEALEPAPGQLCCAITPPLAPHPRMTLTLPVLLGSRHLVLHIIGPHKQRVLQQAMVAGPVAELPVRVVLHQQQTPLEIYHADQ